MENNYGEWDNLIKSAPDNESKKTLVRIVNDFYVPDEIDPSKLKGNYEILRHHNRTIASQSASIAGKQDFTKYATPSIDEFAKIGNQPLGYYDWFLAAYPDVVKWGIDLEDAELSQIMGIVNKDNDDQYFDEGRKLKMDILRKLVDKYTRSHKALECKK